MTVTYERRDLIGGGWWDKPTYTPDPINPAGGDPAPLPKPGTNPYPDGGTGSPSPSSSPLPDGSRTGGSSVGNGAPIGWFKTPIGDPIIQFPDSGLVPWTGTKPVIKPASDPSNPANQPAAPTAPTGGGAAPVSGGGGAPTGGGGSTPTDGPGTGSGTGGTDDGLNGRLIDALLASFRPQSVLTPQGYQYVPTQETGDAVATTGSKKPLLWLLLLIVAGGAYYYYKKHHHHKKAA